MMHQQQTSGRFFAPFEMAFDRLRTPFEEFVHRTTTAGLLLMMTAVLALVLANTLLSSFYFHACMFLLGFILVIGCSKRVCIIGLMMA
jgi:NhaA family Na+:H+ antiporter